MRRRILTVATLAVLTAGCANGLTESNRSLEGIPLEDPDSARFIVNVNKHPNVVQLCIDGAGFATTSRDLEALLRVEAWDDECAEVDR